MARDFAKLLTRIWHDPDWRALSSTDHDVYIALLTTDDLSWCGVAPLLPQRLADFSADLTVRKVSASLERMTERHFLVTDERAGEVAIRSYLRNDKVMSQPNIVRAMDKAYQRIRSDLIAENLHAELQRIHQEEPDLKGWPTLQSINPELWELASNPSAKGSAKGSPIPIRRAS